MTLYLVTLTLLNHLVLRKVFWSIDLPLCISRDMIFFSQYYTAKKLKHKTWSQLASVNINL